MESTKRLYAVDVATLYGKTERTARRMLEKLEEIHGADVVRREGRERYTTREALERVVTPGGGERKAPYDVAKLIATLRRVLSDLAAMAERLDMLDERVTDLSVRIVHAHA